MAPKDENPATTQRTMLSAGPHRAGPRSACVVVIHGEGLGRRADVDERAVVVGRSQEADLHIPHRSVSRQHCQVWRDGDEYRIRDLQATNPTQVNDQAIEEAVLVDGDHITLGESILKFISHCSVEARYHEEIYQLATHDSLTDLHNRRHFIEMADKEIARAMRHRRVLTMCIIDVDLFKPVNDRYGHISGDNVLRQIAGVLRRHVRSDDFAARIGGEEFAVLLPECDIDAAYGFAERLRQAIAGAEFRPGNEAQTITISIGVAAMNAERDTCSRMMAAADAALYRAKSQGRNQVCIQD
ncbi:GGDEF domain-containing protein [Pseudoxanthomonas yeongjuensis]|uniref:GGDEF domain-containing protein n=1 Tax=Pseudoxanthomonas yeongjuensis TaxID=377616 RepID=UPI0013919BCC|nr:GGDEF domain-containing protein [Pseudoxanthomonas yeongjuensis]